MASLTTQVEHVVRAGGLLSPVAFVLVYVVLTVLLVPGSIPTVAAGALFGPLWGSVLTILGATLGASAAFAIARRGGRDAVQRRLGARAHRLDCWLADHGFLAMVYARLIPLVPFNVANYAAGVSGVRPRAYVVATAVGIVPGTIAFVVLGSSLTDPRSSGFVASVGAIVALALAALLVDRRAGRARLLRVARRPAT